MPIRQKLMIIIATIFCALLFLFNNHPLILRFLLILFRLLYGVTLAIASFTPWIRYILIIVFLRGIIIIILYMTRLSSNENVKIPFKSLLYRGVLLPSFALILYISELKKKLVNPNYASYFTKDSFNLIYKSYISLASELTLLAIVYLLIVLIVAVKIVSINKGPLKINK